MITPDLKAGRDKAAMMDKSEYAFRTGVEVMKRMQEHLKNLAEQGKSP